MKLANLTHKDLSLSWEIFDTAGGVGPARLEYCADGDGFIVVRNTAEGYKLFEQGRYIKTTGSDLVQALWLAEHFMNTCGYKATFERCLSYNTQGAQA